MCLSVNVCEGDRLFQIRQCGGVNKGKIMIVFEGGRIILT